MNMRTLFKIWRSFNKLMKILICLFLILIFLIELWFKQPSDPCCVNAFEAIFLGLSYSIVASIIAYFFTYHYPNEYRKIRLVKYINNLSCEISTDICFLIINLKKNKELRCSDPIEVSQLMSVRYSNVYDYTIEVNNRIRKNINNIFTFSSLLSDSSIQSLTLIDEILNIHLDFSNTMKKSEFQTVERILPKIKDLENYKESFQESIKKELHFYLEEHGKEYSKLINKHKCNCL